MTNEEKAREIANEYSVWVESCKTLEDYYTGSYMTMVGKLEKMAEWVENKASDKAYQTADKVQYKNGFIDAIEKACKWLEEQDFGGWIESETEDLINDFKKAMLDEAESKEDIFKEIIDYFRYQALNNPEVKDSRWKWIVYLKQLKQQAQ